MNVDQSTPKHIVLVVDDNPNDIELLRVVLQDDFQVEVAHDGNEGYQKAKELNPQCIISDVRMPAMSGFTFLKKIRTDKAIAEIPLILLTALDDSESKVHGYDLLADLYFCKPVDLAELHAAVKSQVRMYTSRRVSQGQEKLDPTPGKGISTEDQLFLDRVLAALHKNIENVDLSVEDLAKAAFTTRRQLERKLKKLENLTPGEYIRQVRLEHAKKLLDSGAPASISDLASRVGFRDPKYFSKTYRAFYGVSPTINS